MDATDRTWTADLSRNRLQTIPNMTSSSLTAMQLASNEITELLPDHFAGLPNLKSINQHDITSGTKTNHEKEMFLMTGTICKMFYTDNFKTI